MITCLTCSLFPEWCFQQRHENSKFSFMFFNNRFQSSMNASLSLEANTRIIFGCSAIFLLPLLFLLVYIKKILPLRYCRGFVFHTFIGKLSRV